MYHTKSNLVTFFFLLFLFATNIYGASSGKISGTVTDTNTGNPLPGANIILVGEWKNNGQIEPLKIPLGAATDVDGFYYIINVSPGRYVLEAMMIGYGTQRIVDVKVEAERTIKVTFTLNESILESEVVTVVAEKEVVKLDLASSEQIISGDEIQNLPINNIEDVLNLAAGVTVDGYNNEIKIRGGGSDQVMAYLDGFSMKDEVFNVPFLSFNKTSIKDITIKTGGFSAEYGDLRSGVIDVTTEDGGSNYSLSIDSRYSPADYRYSGPHKYTEDKYWLMYGSDWSMDSTKLSQKFPILGTNESEFEGWEVYARREFGKDSSSYLTPNQRRQMWINRHGGREEGNVHDHVIDATLSGPVPYINDLNFMFSYRDQYDSYRHPAQRDHFGLQNAQLKLTYRINPSMQITAMGMRSTQSGMGEIESVGGNSAIVQRSGGLGKDLGGDEKSIANIYSNTYHPLADIETQNFGLSFKHVLSKDTYYDFKASHMSVDYNFRHGVERDTTNHKFIEGEYYTVEQGDTMSLNGYWDADTYITKDTTFVGGDQVWSPGFWLDETPNGWLPYGTSVSRLDQTGRVDLNKGSDNEEFSSGWSTNIRADFTHQANKYHLIKAGFSFRKSMVSRNFKHVDDILNEKLYRLKYEEFPIYYAAYLEDRFEMDDITANIGLRADVFDANSQVLSSEDPFNQFFYADSFRNKYVDKLTKTPSKKHFRLSPRIGISHPLTSTSKIFFNYGHA